MARTKIRFEGLDEFEEFTVKVSSKIESEINEALKNGALQIENIAKRNTPVDTGRLRDSINIEQIDNMSYEIGTNVEYAEAVHEGWRGRTPKPFMKTAYAQTQNKIVSDIENAIAKGLK